MDDVCEPVILSSPQIDEEHDNIATLVYESDNDYDPLQEDDGEDVQNRMTMKSENMDEKTEKGPLIYLKDYLN